MPDIYFNTSASTYYNFYLWFNTILHGRHLMNPLAHIELLYVRKLNIFQLSADDFVVHYPEQVYSTPTFMITVSDPKRQGERTLFPSITTLISHRPINFAGQASQMPPLLPRMD